MAQYENVYVHLSGQYAFSKEPWPYRDLTEWHERLHAPKNRMQGFGADHLLWATDFPWILKNPGYDKLVGVIDADLGLMGSDLRAAERTFQLMRQVADPQRHGCLEFHRPT